jgi:hypothetical protein
MKLTAHHLQSLHQDDGTQSTPSDLYSQLDDNLTGVHPWGNVPARGGRGDLIKKGVTSCSIREVTLGTSLIASAWAAGVHGLDGLAWPEEDSGVLGTAITACWKLVQESQNLEGYESHELDEHVARKVSRSIQ